MKNVVIIAILVVISLVSVAITINVGTIEWLMGAFLITCGSYVIATNIVDYE